MHTEEGLKRVIGLGGLTANIINTIIGAGIFVLPALVSEGLGAAGLLAYLFCAFLITIVLLCFAEVGSSITITGGVYAYIEAAFGRYCGFLTTCLFIFGASLMATAAVANAVADTLGYLFPVFGHRGFRALFFVVLFAGLTLVNVAGAGQGTLLVKITAVAKLIPLLLFVVVGIAVVKGENLIWHQLPAAQDFGKVSLILFFAFQGAENSLSVSGEVKNPSRTIPKSILLSTLCVLVIYLAVQVVAQGVLGSSLANYKGAPLAEAARRVLGPFGKTLMILGAAISMFGYLSGDILNMPRVLFRAAKDRVIPVPALSKVHGRFATPYIAIIAFTVLGCLFSITGGFKQLALLSSASVLLIYLGVALAVIKLRRRGAASPSSFRIPGGLVVPVTAILIIGWFLSHLARNEVVGIGVFIGVLTVLYFALKLFGEGVKKSNQEAV